MNDSQKAINEYIANGGRITKCPEGIPEDLRRMLRAKSLFGGVRAFNNSIAYRNLHAKGDIFASCVARPFTGKKK